MELRRFGAPTHTLNLRNINRPNSHLVIQFHKIFAFKYMGCVFRKDICDFSLKTKASFPVEALINTGVRPRATRWKPFQAHHNKMPRPAWAFSRLRPAKARA